MPALEEGPEETEYKEVTLADIVKVLHRRKLVLGTVFLVVVLAGVGYTALATPQYESRSSIIPLAHQDIIKNWLDSRYAAELVADDLGEPLYRALFPDRWDADRRAWDGNRPSREDAGRVLMENVEVTARTVGLRGENERYLEVAVTLPDPLLARDVASGYIDTLLQLRPHLENITRQEAFDRYYDGSNEQEAQNRAEVTAKQMDYWLMLDTASTPEEPVSPNVTLNIALAVVLGLVLGVFTVFFTEWLSNYRAQNRPLQVPTERRRKGDASVEEPGLAERPKRKYG